MTSTLTGPALLAPPLKLERLGATARSLVAEDKGLLAAPTATISCMRRAVPAALPGAVFVSDGQSADLATARLATMNGRDANIETAQEALLQRSSANREARRGGEWTLGTHLGRSKETV